MQLTRGASTDAGIVISVQVGRGAPLGPEEIMSGFVKTPVQGGVLVGRLGLDGDEQVDLSVHGGPDKAVYAYASRHYPVWRAQFPRHAGLLVPGGLGENLTVDACDETDVCINDVVSVGTVMLQVTQPRQPCFKFALRFEDVAMPRAMLQNGFSGWYYRVLEPGTLAAGATIRLEERPTPAWPIERVNRQIIQRRGTAADRAEYLRLRSPTVSEHQKR